MDKFLYDDTWSTDYQLYICHFGSAPGIETIDGISQKTFEQVNVVGSDEFVIVDNSYSPATLPPFQCIKLDNHCQAQIITPEEFSAINRWCNRNESHKFKIDKEGYQHIYYLGRFNVKPVTVNGEIYGAEFQFVSDYPYGFVDEITQTYYGKEFVIYNHSDEIGCLYPKTVIKIFENGDFTIRNSLDNEIFELKNCIEGEIITIDNKNMIIESNKATHKLYNDFNCNYIKLYNTYTERLNEFTTSLDCEITFIYSPVRKVGII